jgi:hypothetical protein
MPPGIFGHPASLAIKRGSGSPVRHGPKIASFRFNVLNELEQRKRELFGDNENYPTRTWTHPVTASNGPVKPADWAHRPTVASPRRGMAG